MYTQDGPPIVTTLMSQPPSPKRVTAKPLDFAVLILLPSLIFSLIVGLFTFAYQEFEPLVWALVTASALLAALFVSMGLASGRPAHVALGCLLLTSVAAAAPVGIWLEGRYMQEFWQVDSGAEYLHVSPLAPSATVGDASVLRFENGTVVDGQRSLGFMRLGQVYCVAPVVGQGAVPERSGARYWAAGENCCQQRGGFTCGDVGLKDAHSGVVLRGEEAAYYAAAARMAFAAYEMKAGGDGQDVFVRWTADPSAYKARLWDDAVSTTAMAAGVHLLGSSAAALLLARGLMR